LSKLNFGKDTHFSADLLSQQVGIFIRRSLPSATECFAEQDIIDILLSNKVYQLHLCSIERTLGINDIEMVDITTI